MVEDNKKVEEDEDEESSIFDNPNITLLSDGTIQVKLESAVEGYERIILKPPKVKHMRQFKINYDAINVDDFMQIAGKISGTPQGILDQLNLRDMGCINGVVFYFLGQAAG